MINCCELVIYGCFDIGLSYHFTQYSVFKTIFYIRKRNKNVAVRSLQKKIQISMKLYLIEIWILIIMELIWRNQVMKIGIIQNSFIRHSKLFLIDSVVPLILSCSKSVVKSYPCSDLQVVWCTFCERC